MAKIDYGDCGLSELYSRHLSLISSVMSQGEFIDGARYVPYSARNTFLRQDLEDLSQRAGLTQAQIGAAIRQDFALFGNDNETPLRVEPEETHRYPDGYTVDGDHIIFSKGLSDFGFGLVHFARAYEIAADTTDIIAPHFIIMALQGIKDTSWPVCPSPLMQELTNLLGMHPFEAMLRHVLSASREAIQTGWQFGFAKQVTPDLISSRSPQSFRVREKYFSDRLVEPFLVASNWRVSRAKVHPLGRDKRRVKEVLA